MLPVQNKPLIFHIVEKLTLAGVKHVVIVVRNRAEMFRHALAVFPHVQFVRQEDPTGTATALLCAANALRERFLLTYGDLWISLRDYATVRALGEAAPFQYIGINETQTPRGAAVYTSGQRVLTIVEKPKWTGSPDVTANAAGLYVFNKDIIEDCRKAACSVRGEFELNSAVQLAIDRNRSFLTYRLEDHHTDIGDPRRYHELCSTLANSPTDLHDVSDITPPAGHPHPGASTS
jgi:NDP-sugar pyrophosphorylase family protein